MPISNENQGGGRPATWARAARLLDHIAYNHVLLHVDPCAGAVQSGLASS